MIILVMAENGYQEHKKWQPCKSREQQKEVHEIKSMSDKHFWKLYTCATCMYGQYMYRYKIEFSKQKILPVYI